MSRMSAAVIVLFLSVVSHAQSLESLWARGAVDFDGAALHAPSAKPRTVQGTDMGLAELAQALSREPGAIEGLVEMLAGRAGELARPWATPERKAALVKALREADKETLDRFPILTPKELLAAAGLYASRQTPVEEPAAPREQGLSLSGEPALPAPDAFLKPMGYGLLYGDESITSGVSAYGDNLELSQVFNRLADNEEGAPAFTLLYDGERFTSLGGFLAALRARGVSLEVQDRRYFANFGDLRYEKDGIRREVRTPVYVDTGRVLPSGRRLVVPVTHSELSVVLRGPVRGDMSFFFGIDGKASFRPDDTTNMRWVGGRTVAVYSGEAAAALLERAAWVRREMRAKARALSLPLGGYGPLGDCNDVNAMVTGRPAYPMLRDPRLFRGTGGLDAVSGTLPYDLIREPDPAVVLDSLPFEDPSRIPFPEVREGLQELRSLKG